MTGTYLQRARKGAGAVLYEGYLLYPYHQASQKNRSRFQFGVLMPAAYAELDPSEPSASQTQCLCECGDDAPVQVSVRFLQLQHRIVLAGADDPRPVPELVVDGTEYTSWDEAVEREAPFNVRVSELMTGDFSEPFSFGPARTSTDLTAESGALAGQVVRELTAIYGIVRMSAQRVAGPFGALRLTVRIENVTVPASPLQDREGGLAHALIAAHALIGVPGGSFISMTDPPEWAAAEVAACQNVSTWPGLAGPPECRDLLPSS